MILNRDKVLEWLLSGYISLIKGPVAFDFFNFYSNNVLLESFSKTELRSQNSDVEANCTSASFWSIIPSSCGWRFIFYIDDFDKVLQVVCSSISKDWNISEFIIKLFEYFKFFEFVSMGASAIVLKFLQIQYNVTRYKCQLFISQCFMWIVIDFIICVFETLTVLIMIVNLETILIDLLRSVKEFIFSNNQRLFCQISWVTRSISNCTNILLNLLGDEFDSEILCKLKPISRNSWIWWC